MFSLGPHCIGVPASLPEFMEQSGCTIVKYLDPPADMNLPKTEITIGRVHWLSEDKDLSDPIWMAKLHADELSARADVTGIRLWEGINEAPIWNGEDYIRRLVIYEQERARILNSRGIGAVVLNLSVGWPRELEDGIIDWEPFRELLEDLPDGNYLGLHEYWLPTGPLHPDSHLCRAGRLFRCPFSVPILVTECGCDIGGGQHDGWRAQGLSVEQYVTQLAQYRDLLAGDSRVKGATIFTYGTVGQWQSFDWESNWFQFAPICQPVSAEVEVRNPIRLLYQGEVLTVELEDYLRSVVPAESEALWNMEALRAQAVASRSYSMWRKEHPRSDSFDLYADSRDHNYRPDFIHGRTDQAIKDTVGIHLLQNGKVYVSRYVRHCGREDCSLCNGTGGFDDKTWLARLCQYGSRAMADSGSSYRDILRHYYGNIQFSDEGGSMPDNPGTVTLDKYLRPADGSRLGLHWTPVPGHAHSDLTYFIDRAADMGVRWVTLLDDGGGSTLQSSAFYDNKSIVDMFMEVDIIPIIRIYCHPLAKFDARFENTAGRLVERGVRWIFGPNEPECRGEYDDGHVPTDYVYKCTRNFINWAYKLEALGAYPGYFATTTWRFMNENGTRVNPFLEYMSEQERQDIFIHGHGWIPIHNYPKNHPLDFPDDAVNQFGKQLTDAEYQTKLNEVDVTYRQVSGSLWVWDSYQTNASHINLVRDRGINAGATIDDDDVCFRMYQGINRLLDEAGLLPYVPIISTEIGPCIGNREDGRYARVTPQEQIRMVDAMLAEANQVPNYFGMTFWLAGVQRLDAATADGFEDQSLWTDRHNAPFNLQGEIPLVQYLIDNPGGGELPPPEPIEPPEEPAMPEPECDNDAVAYGVVVEPAIVPGGVLYWKCIRVHHLEQHENNGNHNVFVNVYDEDGKRVNPDKARVSIWWQDGQDFIPLDKPDHEPMGNAPLWKGQVVGVRVESELDSDRVMNIHTNHDDEPPGNTRFHHSYLIEFQLVMKAEDPELEAPIGNGCNLILGAIVKLLESWIKA